MMNILVPTDFSNCAKKATDFAIAYAVKNNASVTLLNVFELKFTDAGLFVNFDDSMKDHAVHELKLEGERILEEFNFSVVQEHSSGRLDQTINDFEEDRFDLVIMGTKGSSGIEEVLIGSEAARVISNTNVPVIVIPESTVFSEVTNVLFALELGEVVSREEVVLVDGVCAEDKNIHLFHSYDDAFEIDVEEEHQLKRKFMNYFPGSVIYLDLKFGKNKVNAIESFVDEVNPGVVIVRSRHRKFLQSLFHKSVSEKLSFHLDKPLLVLK